MVDFQVAAFETLGRLVVADSADRKRWAKVGVRQLMRKTGLSQATVYAIITGHPVRLSTLATLRRGLGEL